MSATGFGISIFTFLAVLGAAVLVVLVGAKVLKLVFWLLGRVLRFIRDEIRDVVRFFGHLISFMVLIPLVLLNLLSGNFSRAKHYQRAVFHELKDAAIRLYRICLRNPLALIGLLDVVSGVEKRVPEIMRQAPGTDLKSGERGVFEGYQVIGSLPGGGSGAKLYIAVPGPEKARTLAVQGFPAVQRVVIKSFSMNNGPSLPQIVRESRALESAKRLGLVLEHGIGEQFFYYVMPYVPGDNLSVVVDRMHAASGEEGLPTPQLRRGVNLVSDLLLTLERYHQGGLWHKDVKPDNLVVCGDRAYLVDLGLVTPLASAMTLTTHGTEYYRDPELVRMAMKGAKVNEVDGVRFDIYGTGAVLFSVIEGSFPAHGGLSRITKRCPEALHWVVRRSMAEMNGRYSSAREMLLDLHSVLAADDPFALKPADLPSLGGPKPAHLPSEPPPLREFKPAPAAAAAFAAHPAALPPLTRLPQAPPVPPLVPERRRSGHRFLRGTAFAVAVLLIMGAFLGWTSDRSNRDQIRSFGMHVEALQKRYLDGSQPVPAVEASGSADPDSLPEFPDYGQVITRVMEADVPRERGPGAPRVLFLDDYSSLARPASAEQVAGVLDGLAVSGFVTLGVSTGDMDFDELDLLAGARMAIGLKEPVSALESLGAFLLEKGGLDCGVWIREGEEPGTMDCFLIVLGDEGLDDELRQALGIGVRRGLVPPDHPPSASFGSRRD